MKIALISPNASNLREMAAVVSAMSHQTISILGGKTKMRSVAEHEGPDLMLVEGMCCDPDELTQVEHITIHHPKTVVVLLCPTHTPEFLIQSMRAGVREVLPSPADADMLRAMVSRVDSRLKLASSRPLGKVLAFMPAKGGSGATFMASNLGYHLATSHSVLLIDLNLQFGDALAVLHDGKPASTIADLARGIARLDATLLAASTVTVAPSYSILAAPEDPSQSVEVRPEHVDAILQLAIRQYDYVLLDMSRNLDPMAVKALDRADRIFTVIQQGLPAVRNTSKLLGAFQALGYAASKIEVVVNRFEKSGAIGLDEMRKSLGGAVIHTVPNSFKEVSSSIDHGVALVAHARANAVARTIADFADALRPRKVVAPTLLNRLLKRA